MAKESIPEEPADAPARTIKPSVGTGSVDRERVRSVVAQIADERDATEEASTAPAAAGIPDVLTTHLRLRAADRVANTSLRQVAREIGMSPMGLAQFLRGTAPYAPTLRRLRAWYVQQIAGQPTPLSPEDAYAAVAVLVHDLSPQARRAALEGMLHCLRDGYRRSGRDVPGWIEEIRQQFQVPGPRAY